ncbi:MAG: WG repeat-containing protein, partial [Candidatus Poribacteria bacterium]|nr:WG repeat-containing protein [Candidatus Poribacteria bacterium]
SEWKWGYIDYRGEYVIQPQFEVAHPFVNGIAKVKRDGLWELINREGQLMPTNANQTSTGKKNSS